MRDLICLVDGSKGSLERFKEIKKKNFLAKKFITHKSLPEVLGDAAKLSLSNEFFVLDHGFILTDDFNTIKVDIYDAEHYLICFCTNMGFNEGLYLCSKNIAKNSSSIFDFETKNVEIEACEYLLESFDIIFISYNEPNAESNWQKLSTLFPRAKRVHGIKGIYNAHKEAAKLAETHFFFVVDADSEICEDFSFDFIPDIFDYPRIVVWSAKNSVNGLTYGNGGIKLFRKDLFDEELSAYVDMTLTLGKDKIKFLPYIASINHFDSDPFHAFKGAFRECAKLSKSGIEAEVRLKMWSMFFNSEYAKEVQLGVELGKKYALENEDISKINDLDWLKEQYENAIRL